MDDEIRHLSQILSGEVLIVQASPKQFWAWIGLKRPRSAERLKDALKAEWNQTTRMALGKPAAGPSGWSWTHRQAKAALFLALQGDDPIVHYADVALLAAAANDDLLPAFLRENYLLPLNATRHRGLVLRDTLRAYFSTGRQISSAASRLRVKRHTIRKRLDAVEHLTGRNLDQCAAELELAILLEDFVSSSRQWEEDTLLPGD